MSNPFFDRPIVNSMYEYLHQHWELDETRQPTGHLIDRRRRAEFITPIPKPKKQRGSRQEELDLDERKDLSTRKQAYDLTSIINEVRGQADTGRNLRASQWPVPKSGRIAVKVINHLGDEVMKVFRVE
jgi:type III restriction enzyme